jgi:hypothetical protein
MNSGQSPMDYDNILQTVRSWPTVRRVDLIQSILKTLVTGSGTSRARPKTLSKARGLLCTGRPAPTDAEIRRWLKEHRLRKYG